MRASILLLAVAWSGCAASPFAQVAKARTIEEARKLLGDTRPMVTPYPPNAEAWYFGKNECVLFVDGKVRLSKSSYTQKGDNEVPASKEAQVLCAPSQIKPGD